MDAKEIVKSMDNIEALLAPLDTPITPNDAQHRVNNARQIAQGVKVMLEIGEEENRVIHIADDLESDHQAEAAQESLVPEDEDLEEDDEDTEDLDFCEHGVPYDEECEECEESERYEEADRAHDASVEEHLADQNREHERGPGIEL